MLPVNEIFETIQGEATWTGTPAVFVRLQGCDVGCPWCDTKHTWKIDQDNESSLAAMISKEADGATFAKIPTDTLVKLICQYRARHIVITGGEPCMFDLTELTTGLIEAGKSVQIETSGTEPIKAHPLTWVTVSPKFGMPGGKKVLPESLARADEIKLPVGRPADIARFTSNWHELHDTSMIKQPVWLQPLSASAKATALCVETATIMGWKVSIQTHKFIGVR